MTCTAHGCLAEQSVFAWVAQFGSSGFGGLSAKGWYSPPSGVTNVLASEGDCSVWEPVGGDPANLPVALDVGSEDVTPPGPLTAGSSWTLDWSDPSPPAAVEILLDGGARIWCGVDGPSEVTIPVSIIDMLPAPEANTYSVRLILWGERQGDALPNGVWFEALAQRWIDLDVSAGGPP